MIYIAGLVLGIASYSAYKAYRKRWPKVDPDDARLTRDLAIATDLAIEEYLKE